MTGGDDMETTEKTRPQSSNTPETFTQQWSHIRQQAKGWWDRLTDADLELVTGQKDKLVRALENRYGYARERAEQEVNRRLEEFYQTQEAAPSGGLGEVARGTAQEIASTLTKTASEAGTTAQKLATTAVTSVGDTMARAGRRLPELPSGLADFIRRYPVPSLVAGIGLGFLLGRSSVWMGGTASSKESIDESVAGYPDALIQCSRCGEMVRQADMVAHSATCRGSGVLSHGGSTS
jgi:uncharacterized protein YjbJ (UPF0337 family)